GGASANITTLPTVTPASGVFVKVTLSATEMTADNVTVSFIDAAGAEWCDLLVNIQTAARQIDDLAYPTTSGRSIDVDTTGGVEVGTIAADAITAAAIATAAIDADAIASDAIGSAEFAQAAADKIWSSATRALTDKANFALAAAEYDNINKAVSGTVDSGSTTTIIDAERTEAATDYWKGSVIYFTGGGNIGIVRRITAFNAATDTLTLSPALPNAAAAADTYIILRNEFAEVLVDAMKADTLTASALAADAVTEMQSGLATSAALSTVQSDTDDIQSRLPAALVSGRIDASVGAMAADVITSASIAAGAIGSSEAPNLDAAVSSRATPAQVNTEVLDVLNVDTFAEPAQGAPPATATLIQKIGYLFKFLRNRHTQTATTLSVYADDATTVDQKATVSDDATTFDRGEIVSGP
ncbi:MAG TPA: hypothetical protein VGR85_09065, partial [Candidatus Limnocylindria bacterium]|nr:hypothetical protein [Candidatus Limnocylindria bacterium]